MGLFAGLPLVFGGGAAINAHEAGKLEFYLENPAEAADAAVDASTDGYRNGFTLDQKWYKENTND